VIAPVPSAGNRGRQGIAGSNKQTQVKRLAMCEIQPQRRAAQRDSSGRGRAEPC